MARLLAAAEELALMGSWELDLRSGETLWSDGMYRILGLPRAGERQTLAQALGHVHPDDRERMERMLADVAARPETVPEAGIEHVLLREAALERGMASVIAFPAVGPDGPVAVLSFCSVARRARSSCAR